MKRVRKKTNKQTTREYKLRFCFGMLFVIYLVSALFLKNYNVKLEHDLNAVKTNNQEITQQNQTLKLKIDDLSSFERMSSFAKKNGLENREGTIKNVK